MRPSGEIPVGAFVHRYKNTLDAPCLATNKRASGSSGSRWALRVSNPRPSPCKGETNVQVRVFSLTDHVLLSTPEYL